MIASGSQIRAARAGLGWSQEELAGQAGIHAKAVSYWEHRQRVKGWAAERMLAAFESAGVEVVAEPRIGVFFDA